MTDEEIRTARLAEAARAEQHKIDRESDALLEALDDALAHLHRIASSLERITLAMERLESILDRRE